MKKMLISWTCKKLKPAFLLTLGCLLLIGCSKDESNIKTPAVKVVLEKPVKMLFQDKLCVQGTVETRDHAKICAKASGTLNRLVVSEGEHVKKDQLLFQTDKVNLENKVEISKQSIKVAETALKQAEVDLTRAEIKLAKYTIDYGRAQRLIKGKAISKTAYEEVELLFKDSNALVNYCKVVLDHTRAQLAQAKGNYAIAKKQLEDSMVRAPFNGVITDKYIEEGEYAVQGSPVLNLVNPDILETSLLISAKYYNKIHPNKTQVEISDGANELMLKAMVTYRSPIIDPTTRTFEIKITLPKKNGFVSGMLCCVNLILSSHEGYGVPSEAIMQKSNNKMVVFTVADKKAKMISVIPGITDKNFTELKEGEKLKSTEIVVQGQSFLNEGTTVKVLNKTGNSKQVEKKSK